MVSLAREYHHFKKKLHSASMGVRNVAIQPNKERNIPQMHLNCLLDVKTISKATIRAEMVEPSKMSENQAGIAGMAVAGHCVMFNREPKQRCYIS